MSQLIVVLAEEVTDRDLSTQNIANVVMGLIFRTDIYPAVGK